MYLARAAAAMAAPTRPKRMKRAPQLPASSLLNQDKHFNQSKETRNKKPINKPVVEWLNELEDECNNGIKEPNANGHTQPQDHVVTIANQFV